MTRWRLSSALGLCLASAGACGAALAEGASGEPIGASHVTADEPLREGPADAGADGEPRCPHGALEDPHRGFVRCLEPGEADAGGLPPAPQPEPPDAGVDAAPPVVTAGPPPQVEAGSPAYENGDVPNVPKVLKAVSADVGKCVADHGGLSSASGNLKVQFLVRNRGRAEGVEVLSSKGVTDAAATCVRLLLKNKAIGSPSADPVGVTVTFALKRSSG